MNGKQKEVARPLDPAAWLWIIHFAFIAAIPIYFLKKTQRSIAAAKSKIHGRKDAKNQRTQRTKKFPGC